MAKRFQNHVDQDETQRTKHLEDALDVSVNLARSVVSKWIGGEDTETAKLQSEEQKKKEKELEEGLLNKKQRVGLGAKFLSHNQAQLTNVVLQDKIKTKILNNKRKKGEGEDEEGKKKKQKEENEVEGIFYFIYLFFLFFTLFLKK